jgi:putative methyltransferase (TIGR04325 family)
MTLWVPYGLVQHRRARRPPPPSPASHFWEGVYKDLESVPRWGEGYASATWKERTRRWTEGALRAHREQAAMPAEVMGEHRSLVTLASIIAPPDRSLTVLDFGGGTGLPFVHLVDSVARADRVQYEVIDIESLCAIGRALFRDDGRVRFHSDFPDLTTVDIVYSSSSLQYIADYPGVVRRLMDYAPRYLLLAELPMDSGIPTYASAQRNIEGSSIPTWFFSLDEIVGLVTERGYELASDFRSEWVHDQSNFPESHRPRNKHTLLFARARSANVPE